MQDGSFGPSENLVHWACSSSSDRLHDRSNPFGLEASRHGPATLEGSDRDAAGTNGYDGECSGQVGVGRGGDVSRS
jgi:hypothetical protein